MENSSEYAIVRETVYTDETKIAKGTIVKVVEEDSFMKKCRILKRVETLHPEVLMSLNCDTWARTGTVKKVIKVLDALYKINAGDSDRIYYAKGVTKLLEKICEDLGWCSQAVEEINDTEINFLLYLGDADECYYCGENFLKHLGLALMWAVEVKKPSQWAHQSMQSQFA